MHLRNRKGPYLSIDLKEAQAGRFNLNLVWLDGLEQSRRWLGLEVAEMRLQHTRFGQPRTVPAEIGDITA